MATSNSIDSRTSARRRIRERRRALVGHERSGAESKIARALQQLPAYRKARHIAVYFSTDGEVDLERLVAAARAQGKRLYAPVLAGLGLRFVEISSRGATTRNRFGIPEPDSGRCIDPRSLDVVLTPLVGFDAHGTRLGMGKGYYDRTFAFLTLRRRWIRPKLIGIGFGFQSLARLSAQPWDVRLWAAVTETRTAYFDSTPAS